MASRQVRLIVGLVAPLVALWLANWFDGQFVADAGIEAGRSFDIGQEMYATNVGLFATAALVLAVAAVILWSQSRIVAVFCIVLGGFYAFLPALEALLALRVNDDAPSAQEPVATFINARFAEVISGTIGSVYVVGAALLLAGVAALIRDVLRGRSAGSARPELPEAAAPSV